MGDETLYTQCTQSIPHLASYNDRSLGAIFGMAPRAVRQKYLQRRTGQVFYLTEQLAGTWLVEGPADDPEPFRMLGIWKSRFEALQQLALLNCSMVDPRFEYPEDPDQAV